MVKRFWEDQWFGSSSLAIQYWQIYMLINEKSSSIAEAWDGVNLKFTFRRNVSEHLMNIWEELVAIASSISFVDERCFDMGTEFPGCVFCPIPLCYDKL